MRKGSSKRRKVSRAEAADRYVLYQQSVQSPEADIEFFIKSFRKLRGRQPRSLREDFCGTAYLSCEWVRDHPRRTALGVDLGPETLRWGEEHNLSRLDGGQSGSVELILADVLDVPGPPVDLTCALNFSFCVFKTRDLLRRYFEVVIGGLKRGGVFFCELYGGTEAIIELEEEREVEDFTFIWEQEKFNPLTHETLCHIHFEFEDGSRLERAFTYDWRLWSIPEVRELLEEVGFSGVDVYWEEVDEDGDGTGEYHLALEEENQESWLVYLVAAK
ncbi:MAG: class I SAM-dependent methyltransferase [Thermoanaerobaculia bacterium]